MEFTNFKEETLNPSKNGLIGIHYAPPNENGKTTMGSPVLRASR